MQQCLDSLPRNAGAEEMLLALDKIVREIAEAAPIQYLSLMSPQAN